MKVVRRVGRGRAHGAKRPKTPVTTAQTPDQPAPTWRRSRAKDGHGIGPLPLPYGHAATAFVPVPRVGGAPWPEL